MNEQGARLGGEPMFHELFKPKLVSALREGYGLSRLRADARTADTPVLIISASSTPEEEERSLEVGAKAFLPKPVNEHDLLREIGAHLKLEWTE